ncbi:pitrilysin family protein [Tissierella sp. Yu-01]|uniref:M16 family metallopeptidase n=1 Tax=Tissierella sp. Yu-01 TaxID=3035694 RepID=UPI00240D5D52|nr:pitrilysin family protein [Tissierella sp. Yu-01]WFA09754.1 pitrilysin family protein [Tissierella sp. Yu-01]
MYIVDKLDNGIRVVMESIEYVNSVTIGVIIDNGSIKETKSNNGISHFIEHMLFKGTTNRTPKQIAESIDDIGGQLNAFTGKEQTCFYAKVLDQHLPIAIDVLGDMFNNSLFLKDDIEKEKGVIIEEINMYEDSPEDLVFEVLNDIMFENTSLELPILGTQSSIKNLTRENTLEYFHQNYLPEEIIISLAGKFNPKEVVELLNSSFGNFNSASKLKNGKVIQSYEYRNKIKGVEKNIEQLNICIGLEGVDNSSEDIHPILVLNNIFGGSMSSRLFQEIREERGLVYTIDSHLATYNDTGIFNIYAGLNSNYLVEVMELINKEIVNMKKNLISKDELKKSKEQLKGNFILGMEGTFSRMFENAKSLLQNNEIETPQDVLEKIDKVTLDDIERVINIIFNKEKLNIAYVGEIEDKKSTEDKLRKIFEMRCNYES